MKLQVPAGSPSGPTSARPAVVFGMVSVPVAGESLAKKTGSVEMSAGSRWLSSKTVFPSGSFTMSGTAVLWMAICGVGLLVKMESGALTACSTIVMLAVFFGTSNETVCPTWNGPGGWYTWAGEVPSRKLVPSGFSEAGHESGVPASGLLGGGESSPQPKRAKAQTRRALVRLMGGHLLRDEGLDPALAETGAAELLKLVS